MKRRKSEKKMRRLALLAVCAIMACQLEARVSATTTVDSRRGFSLLGRTLGTPSPEVCWRWPALADRAVLNVTGLNGTVLTREFTDRAISRFTWTEYAVPESPEGEDLLTFSLTFFAGQEELADERLTVEGIASVSGRGARDFTVLPADAFSGARRRWREPSAVGLLTACGQLSVDGLAKSSTEVPDWFGFPIRGGRTYGLSFAPVGGDVRELSIRGTSRPLCLLFR